MSPNTFKFGDIFRESGQKHILTIMAKDQGTPTKRNYARVVIHLEDSNNHAPEWSVRLIEGYVLDSAEPGSKVITLLATDKDRGENADISYYIISGKLEMLCINKRV